MKVVVSQEGQVKVNDIPLPKVEHNFVLVKTEFSAISPGTELLMLKKRHQVPIPLGYSATGIVTEVGEGVSHVGEGQRVACYGAPYVKHAEYLLVPKHLAVPVPSQVNPKEAAMVGLGAIAIHALRQADLRFGENAIIVGLGILGQIMAQVAHAASIKVIAYDLLLERCNKLKDSGFEIVCRLEEDLEEQVKIQTNAEGVDSVILCANGENTNLIDKGLGWIRDRGNVVIVGDLKMEFSRDLMFNKEANIVISRAGGPGRYDSIYEKGGIQYPIGYVRWTEGKNMAEYIRLLAEGRLNITPLISHIVSVDNVSDVYDSFINYPKTTLGILIEY
jgi:NADPH2:quinone reductase